MNNEDSFQVNKTKSNQVENKRKEVEKISWKKMRKNIRINRALFVGRSSRYQSIFSLRADFLWLGKKETGLTVCGF